MRGRRMKWNRDKVTRGFIIVKSTAPIACCAQLMSPVALLKSLTDSLASDTWKRVLAQRFSTPDECVVEVFNARHRGGAYCCLGADGTPLGWAVYFRFHERAGYEGCMNLVLHSLNLACSSVIFDVLSSACASRGLEQGLHTLISVVDSNMKTHAAWFSDSPFILGGAVEAKEGSTLKVFYRKLF